MIMASVQPLGCRLTDNEFRELMPHLELEELFMIHFKRGVHWAALFIVLYKPRPYHDQIKAIKCQLCQEKVTFESFKTHLTKSIHVEALKAVEQLYHPFYTYYKNAGKLARGESVSNEEFEAAIMQANAEEVKIDDSKLEANKEAAQRIRNVTCSTFDKTMMDVAAKTNVKKPDNFVVEVGLPLLDLLKLEYSIVDGEWKPVLTTDRPNPNSKYYCALCAKYCAGIITVNAHFKGYLHKTKQLESLGIRCEGYDHLTKNCEYRYSEKYSFTIKKGAQMGFKEKTIEFLKHEEEAGLKQNNEKSQNEKNSSECATGTEEIEIKPLSSDLEAKVKALKEYRQKNADIEGLIGVEYVVKLMKSENDPTPMYECCLCEIVLNEARMQGHLIGYNHRLKYCDIHYPDTIKKFKDIIGHVKYSDYFNAMGHILAKVALAIEQHHGRSLPYVVPTSKFSTKRADVVAQVYSFRNACQQHGPSFTNAISTGEIKRILSAKVPYKQAPAANELQARFIKVPGGKVYLDQRSHDPNKRVVAVSVPKRNRSKSPRPKNEKYQSELTKSRSASFSPVRFTERTRSSCDQRRRNVDIWKVYRDEISSAASEVERHYAEYRKNPEGHPLYDQEWNKFWRRRKEELLSQGIDHRSYNYQPEWVQFFRQRLEQLFGEELQESQVKIRHRLNIPLDAEEDNRLEKHTRSSVKDASPHNIEPQAKRQRSEGPNSSNWNAQPPSGWIQNNTYKDKQDTLLLTANLQHATSDPLKKSLIPIDDGKPKVIHVLRLLTALEDHLGSLGGKVMDLLSKALTLEKICLNNPSELDKKILTFENCMLLETCIEKLKGLLYAGLLDANKVSSFNRVIQHTSDILKQADRMGWRTLPDNLVEKPSNTIELQKLLEVMQNSRSGMSASNQKSLSDTLMDLISMQKGSLPEMIERNSSKKIDFPYSEGLVRGNQETTMYNRQLMGINAGNYVQNDNFNTNEMNSMNRMSNSCTFSGNNQARAFGNNHRNMNTKSNISGNNEGNFNRMANVQGNNIGSVNTAGNRNLFGSNSIPRTGLQTFYNQGGNPLMNNVPQPLFPTNNDGLGNVNIGNKGPGMWQPMQRH